MTIIKPKVEYVPESEDYMEQIAKCASICYKSSNVKADKLYNSLIRDGHFSMLRHASVYYIIPPNTAAHNLITKYLEYCEIFDKNPYIFIYVDKVTNIIYLSTNRHYLFDNEVFATTFNNYLVTRSHFEANCPTKDLTRLTFFVTTSIKVSRELNRVSPNNIAEQSTRYVNLLNKQGGACVCESIEQEYLTAADASLIRNSLADSCDTYDNLILSGVKPEDARRVLPIDAATKVAYTYTVSEWKHILDIRYHETTGKAAPDCKRVAEMIYNEMLKLNYI